MPRGWIWVRLPAIASILYGYPFDSQKFNSIGEGVPLIRIRDVLSGTTKTFTTEDCPERYIIHNGDMLVGMDGNFNVSFWKGGPAFLNQRVCRISALGTNELQRFLFYYLPFVFERIENSASFVTVKHLSDKHLSAALIPLPPRPEQKRIVEKIENLLPRLDEYDKAQTAADTYEAAFPDAFRKSILQAAVQGKLVAQIPTDEPAEEMLARLHKTDGSSSVQTKRGKGKTTPSRIFRGSDKRTYETRGNKLIRIDDELPFAIPDSWSWARLPSISSILYGFPFDSQRFNTMGTGVPLIRIRDVLPGRTKTCTTEKCDERYIINDGDMLVGMDGNFNVAFWKGGRALLNQRVCRISTNENVVLQHFLFFFLPFVFERIEQEASFVTVKHLSDKHISSVLVPIPPLAEQARIVAEIERLLALGDRLRETL